MRFKLNWNKVKVKVKVIDSVREKDEVKDKYKSRIYLKEIKRYRDNEIMKKKKKYMKIGEIR